MLFEPDQLNRFAKKIALAHSHITYTSMLADYKGSVIQRVSYARIKLTTFLNIYSSIL